MQALIFAAGRGERMRPLTDTTPKPLLPVGGQRLIEWHLRALARRGVSRVVINTSHLAEQFPAALGDGADYGLHIAFSYEGPEPLETGGGMRQALMLMDDGPFIAINGDIWTDFDLANLPLEPRGLAHLVLVDNPAHHARGDFALGADATVKEHGTPMLTFAGIGVYRPALIAEHTPGRFKLAPLLYDAARAGRLHGTRHAGRWTDVGTIERLTRIDTELRARQL